MDKIEIRTLAVRQPWASLIIERLKTHEVRAMNTLITGPTLIYASKTDYSKKYQRALKEHFLELKNDGIITDNIYEQELEFIDHGIRGAVLGIVDITYSIICRDEHVFNGFVDKHMVPKTFFKNGIAYLWELENVVKFDQPVKIDKWPSGGVWAKLPKSMFPEL